MFAEEWPLLLFTLFTQLAVGLYLFTIITRAVLHKNVELSTKLTSKGLLAVGPITVIALFLSVFHLGDPFGAYRSLYNLASAWLSREIIFVGGFFALWFISYFLERKGKWNQLVGYVTAIFGLFAIYSMASIYANSILPAWSDINTYLAFYGTTIVFGSVAMMMMLSFSKETEQEQVKKLIRTFAFVGLAAIVIQLVYLPVYTSDLASNGGNAGLESVALLTGSFAVATIIRWVASIIGLVLISWVLLKNSTKLNYGFIVTAFACVLIGEFLGRYIFYSIGVKIIVG